jgi:hypothetical protein
MLRRTFLLSGFTVVLLAAGSAIGFGHATVSSAGGFPWTSTTPTPAPALPGNEASPPGGLGNTKRDLEATYGATDGLQGTMLSYRSGSLAASFTLDRATSLLVNFGNPPVTDLGIARGRVQAFMPLDSTLVGTIGAGANRVAEIYHSDRLATKVVAPHASDPSGQFVVIYQSDSSGAITQALLAIGSAPTA